MAALAFDPLEYTHELEASGVPRAQAEVHARAMTARFIYNFDALVTRDYLGSRFSEFELRIEAAMDKRFGEVDKRFGEVDKRFGEVDRQFKDMQSGIDKRFTQLETRVDRGFDALEVRFERIDSKFSRIYLMFGLTMVTATIPILQNLFGQA